ncbi:MAG: TetR/AcrR family transcriptional regulator [Mobilicoccus sp.]|nr:TetR/AcrR family transcriptional regulator [Mobilicoccus sp.]
MSRPRIPRTDQRVTRTHARLTAALVDLSSSRPFETVTVRDLTEHAGVGYATFFRHYPSIEGLLRATVDDLYSELVELLPPLAGGAPREAGAVVFRHVAEHPEVYRLLLWAPRSYGLLERMTDIATRGLDEAYEPLPDATVPPDVAAGHFVAAFLGLIDWWLAHDMPYPPEQMGGIYEDLVLRPVEATALRRRDATTAE